MPTIKKFFTDAPVLRCYDVSKPARLACKEALPTSAKLLQSCCDPGATAKELAGSKRLQCRLYNQGTKKLPPLQAGDTVRTRLPGEQKWSLGRCTRSLSRCSYEVELERREQPPRNYTEEVIPEKTQAESHAHDLEPVIPTNVNNTPKTLVGPEGNVTSLALAEPEENVETLPSPEPRRLDRIRRSPA